MKNFLWIILILLIGEFSFAQKISEKQAEIQKADFLKKKYSRDDFVMKSFETIIEFEKPKTSDKKKVASSVVAKENAHQVIMAIKDGSNYASSLYYNPQIELKEVRSGKENGSTSAISAYHTNYQSNGIFHDDSKLCVFSIPYSARAESRQVTYERRYLDTKYLTSVIFHEPTPILHRKLTFIVPDWLDVELKEMNFEGYKISKEKKYNASAKLTTYTYELDSLDAYRSEKNSPRLVAHYPHILVLTKAITNTDGEKVPIIGTTDDLYKWYHSLVLEIGNDATMLKPIVEKLTDGLSTDFEKVKSIFYYVQDNIRYIAFEDGIMGFKPDAAQNVYNKKYGDCKGMANLLCEMLKIAGYDARLTWLGTRGIPYDYSTPSIAVDNHMICTLILNEKKYFLDATEKFITIDDYADRIQGRQVMIENGDKYILERIPVYNYERNIEKKEMYLALENNQLKGKCTNILEGEGKTSLLQSYSMIKTNEKETAINNYLTDHDKNIIINNVIASDLDKREGQVKFNYDIVINHAITAIDDEVYLSLDQDLIFADFDFDSLRTNPFVMPYKINMITDIVFSIPQGYSLDYIPDPLLIQTNGFVFSIEYKQEADNIHYYKHIYSDAVEIKPEGFKDWNLKIKKLKASYKDQIIIKKR